MAHSHVCSLGIEKRQGCVDMISHWGNGRETDVKGDAFDQGEEGNAQARAAQKCGKAD